MLHIMLANENRGRGGAEQFTSQLGRALIQAGYRVTLACRKDSWLAQQGFQVAHLPFRSELDPASYLAAYRQLRPLAPDVIHCQATRDLALFGSLRRIFLRQTSLVKSDHSFLDCAGSAWLRWCYRQCEAVVPVSIALRRQMQEVIGGTLPYQVIYNAMAVPKLDQPVPERLREHYWVGYVGALLESKRVEDVIHATTPLLRERPDTRLLLAGDGPARIELESLARELGLQERIWMPGHLEDPLPYLAGLKVLVQASPRETFSLVALEAMALQVPVVAYAREGLAEVVVDGETGSLSSHLDPAALGQRVEYYAHNEEVRVRHGHNGRRRVKENFSWEVILPQWEALYRNSLLGNHAARGQNHCLPAAKCSEPAGP